MKNLSYIPENSSSFWIYGAHAIQAALLNPVRQCYHLLYLEDSHLKPLNIPSSKKIKIIKATRQDFATLFPIDAVHQGVALSLSPLRSHSLEEILHLSSPQITLVTLDQITDPHNFGAIIRSAVAFGISALLTQDRHSPDERNPVLYKAASGGLEILPIVRVTNLSRALEQLQYAGFWNIGFDEEGPQSLAQSDLSGRINLVLGSEGQGLRRLTKNFCDMLVHLPTSFIFKTLNVSNAAAIAFYETHRQKEIYKKRDNR